MKTQVMLAIRVVLVAALSAGLARAQDAGPQPEPDKTDLQIQLESLTPEQIEALLARAAAATLQMERDAVKAEIEGDLLYDPKDKAAAVKLLQDGPRNTQEDNIDRICKAFAAVEEDFAAGCKLLAAGRYDEAAKKTKAILDAKRSTYLSAAGHFLHAESLFKLGRYDDAIETYAVILSTMPDRFSFAVASGARTAEAYEKMSRFYYAAETYVLCINSYGPRMTSAELEKFAKRLEYLQAIYKDPLAAVGDRMGQVKTRLEKRDSGKATREQQQEIAAILEDLIKTAEEKQNSGGGGGQSPQPKDKDKGKQKPGDKDAATPKGGRAGGRPTKPAERGFLPPGLAERPKNLGQIRPSEGADDWSKLPPEKRQEIESAMKKLLPERYKKLIEDYRKELSKGSAGAPE